MPREEAVRLVAQLMWRGVAGFPRLQEDGDTEVAEDDAEERLPGTAGTAKKPNGKVADITDLADRPATRIEPVAAEFRTS
jgi:hypothetical protein